MRNTSGLHYEKPTMNDQPLWGLWVILKADS